MQPNYDPHIYIIRKGFFTNPPFKVPLNSSDWWIIGYNRFEPLDMHSPHIETSNQLGKHSLTLKQYIQDTPTLSHYSLIIICSLSIDSRVYYLYLRVVQFDTTFITKLRSI